MDKTLCDIAGTKITAKDVLAFMKMNGSYHNARRTVVMNEVIRDHAVHGGLQISDETLQAYSDLRRLELGLHNANETNDFFEALGITLEEWEETLENELFREKARAAIGNSVVMADAWKLVKGIPEVRNHITDEIINKAKTKGIAADDKILQETSDDIRRIMGMHSLEEFQTFLAAVRMNEDDWEKHVHSGIVLNQLQDENLEEFFRNEIANALQKYPVLNSLISDMLFGQIIHAKAKKNNIDIEENEIQEFVDNFRRIMKLHSVATFETWLNSTGFSMDEFEYMVVTELLKRKFAKDGIELFNDEKIVKAVLASKEFAAALNDMVTYAKLFNAAGTEGIKATEKEINDFSDNLRRMNGLHNAAETGAWLDAHAICEDTWADMCEKGATINKFYEAKTGADDIMKFLNENEAFMSMVKEAAFKNYAASL